MTYSVGNRRPEDCFGKKVRRRRAYKYLLFELELQFASSRKEEEGRDSDERWTGTKEMGKKNAECHGLPIICSKRIGEKVTNSWALQVKCLDQISCKFVSLFMGTAYFHLIRLLNLLA